MTLLLKVVYETQKHTSVVGAEEVYAATGDVLKSDSRQHTNTFCRDRHVAPSIACSNNK